MGLKTIAHGIYGSGTLLEKRDSSTSMGFCDILSEILAIGYCTRK